MRNHLLNPLIIKLVSFEITKDWRQPSIQVRIHLLFFGK